MSIKEVGAPAAFGERFARNHALGMAGLGVFAVVAVVVQGSVFAFIATAACLALSYFFRRRAHRDEAHGRRAVEDERDRDFAARGDRVFRLAASTWMAALAVASCLPAVRDVLLAPPLRMPGLLLLGVIAANVAAHVAVAMLYRRDRS